jgi:CIC family chloride channel protein
MRMRVIFVKAFASASSIGAGASVGREGPIVQMGSGIGSVIARFFKLHEERTKTCVACGAAAGIAATFNAPIAGVIFSQEVILGKFNPAVFVPVVISSVTASVISRIYVGDAPAFSVQAYPLHHPMELFLYVLLGILAAVFGIIFTKVLYKTEDIFDCWKSFPSWLKPVFGGLMVGFIGLYFPQILGVGYETIEGTFQGQFVLSTLILLVLVKIFATSVTWDPVTPAVSLHRPYLLVLL